MPIAVFQAPVRLNCSLIQWSDFVKLFEQIGKCDLQASAEVLHVFECEFIPEISAGGPPGFEETHHYNPRIEITSRAGGQRELSLTQRDTRGNKDAFYGLYCAS